MLRAGGFGFFFHPPAKQQVKQSGLIIFPAGGRIALHLPSGEHPESSCGKVKKL